MIFLSHPAGRDLASSGVIGCGASTHPRLPKKPVLDALANFKAILRNENFRLLSILARSALERLD
jgi:hypothetical protein